MLRPEATGRVQAQLPGIPGDLRAQVCLPWGREPRQPVLVCYPFPAPPARCLVKWPSACLGLGVWAFCAMWMLWPFTLCSEGLGPCS